MKKTFTVNLLAAVLLVVSLLIATGAAGDQTDRKPEETQKLIAENSEWGILILPTEGKRIHALQVDLERYRNAQNEDEQDKVLQELLSNPNNKIVEMTPTDEPSKGGTTEAGSFGGA